MLSDFYKKNKNDKIWWIEDLDSIGKHMFSFDKENPYWKDFFKERTK